MEHIELEIRALREDVKALSAQLNGVVTPKLMNTAQCAAFLGKSPDILYEWRKERKGRPSCISRSAQSCMTATP